MLFAAVDLEHRAYLCGSCESEDAHVIVSESNNSQYGHCAICDHSVFLGEYGRLWQRGEPWGVF
jgi:hypothetical protein